MGRFRQITLGRAMALMAVLTLVAALIVQARRAAEREARYQAEIARLRKLVSPDWLYISDHNPTAIDNIKP